MTEYNDDHVKGPAPYPGAKRIQQHFKSHGQKRDPEQVQQAVAQHQKPTASDAPPPYHGASKIKQMLSKK